MRSTIKFDLFTNFTFFLNDPVNGDGIQQSDRRVIYGGDLGYKQRAEVFGMPSIGTIGFQTRVDDIHARLGYANEAHADWARRQTAIFLRPPMRRLSRPKSNRFHGCD